MAKKTEKITLLDLLTAIENEKPLFQTEYNLNVTGNRPDKAKKAVNEVLTTIEKTMKRDLQKTTLKDILDSM
jgi:DNA-binding IscR family transcriptional regulator